MQKINFLKGFTIIELIVVIAIIAVLASVVMVSVTQYIEKSKVARLNSDVENITKALTIFKTQFGDYPLGTGTITPRMGEPYLYVDGVRHYFSETYNFNWTGKNADYFVKDGFFEINFSDVDGNGQIGCAVLFLTGPDYSQHGNKYIICEDCNYCGGAFDSPFTH